MTLKLTKKARSMFILLMIMMGIAEAKEGRPAPGVPRINETLYETDDYVITTHNILDYGAKPNDGKDDTKTFQKAINDVSESGGGIIFVPAGRYVFNRKIVLKSGVILRGEWRNPDKMSSSKIGTLFCVYYGRNMAPDQPPFIHMFRSTGIKDIAIWYPEQRFDAPVPYASTLKQAMGNAASVENVTIYNAWRGLILGPETNQLLTVKNLYMTALHIGFIRDEAYDNPRLHKVYMSPKYWVESGLKGAPATPAEEQVLRAFLLKESVGAMITHYDWVWMYDWVIEGFHIGVQTRPSLAHKRSMGGPNGGWVKLHLKDNFIGMQVGKNNHQGWFSTDVLITSKVKDSIGIQTTEEFGSTAQFANVTFDGRFKHCIQTLGKQGKASFSGCRFKRWARDTMAVNAEAGTIELLKCKFYGKKNHISLGNRLNSAAILNNAFNGKPHIVNSAPKTSDVVVDHQKLDIKLCDISDFKFPEAIHKPRKKTLYNVRDFGAKGDGKTDDSGAFQRALDKAKVEGGGTVYVPVGRFALRKGIVVPEYVELRGVFDMTHHTIDFFKKYSVRGSEIFAYAGKGQSKGTPLIRLKSESSLRGITVYYPEQLWSNYLKKGEFTPYPWTIQSMGPNVRLKDVAMVNSYLGADFGTYESTGHRIDYLCGSPIKVGLYVDKCYGEGFIKNTHWNPSWWAWACYTPTQPECETVRNALMKTLTSYVFGYTKKEHTLHMFSYGSRYGAEFIKNKKHGGANGLFIGNGTDLSSTAVKIHDIGKNAKFVNYQIVSMETDERKRYINILDGVKGRAEFYNLLMWGYQPSVDCGIEMQSGDFYFLQLNFRTFGTDYGIKQTGGRLKVIAPSFYLEPGGLIHKDKKTKKKTVSGKYAYFGKNIESAEVIGMMVQGDAKGNKVYDSEAPQKVKVKHTISHKGKAGYY